MKSLDALNKDDINIVKSFSTPPQAVQTVMGAVCVLFGEKEDWASAKKLLSRTTLIKELQDFDKDNIPMKRVQKIAKNYFEDPNMQVDVVKNVSTAAMSLCMWARAMKVYAEIAKDVAPKQARVDELNEELRQANEALSKKQAELQAVVDRVDNLQSTLDNTMEEKQRLADESQLTQDRLSRSSKLTEGCARAAAPCCWLRQLTRCVLTPTLRPGLRRRVCDGPRTSSGWTARCRTSLATSSSAPPS